MNEIVARDAQCVALGVSHRRNRQLLLSLLEDQSVVTIEAGVPGDADLCIVDEPGFRESRAAIGSWRDDQHPSFAPVLLLVDDDGRDPWGRYAAEVGGRLDAIQPIPAPKSAIRARVDALLETRRYSTELAAERQLVEQIFDTSPIGKVVLDADGVITRVNPRAGEIFGKSPSALVGLRYAEFEWRILDESGDPVPESELAFARVMSGGDPVYDSRYAIERPDGDRTWVSVNAGPIRGDDGGIEYVVSSIEDVTERKRLERELRESEELHRATLENITDTVCITDDDGRFTYVCPNVNHIFGMSVDEVRDLGGIDGLLGEDPMPDRIGDGTVENVEHTITDADGREHVVLVTVTPVDIQGGTRLYSIRDVTALVESERELERERERLDTIVSNAPLILTVIDPDGTVTLTKGQLEGLTLDAAGRSVAEVFPADSEIAANVDRLLGGEEFSADVTVGDRVFETWHKPVFRDGNLDHGIVIGLDVTERKRQEERFQAFVEGSSDIITVVNDDGVIEYVSPSVERVLGYEPAALVGENAFDLVHPSARGRVMDAFAGLGDDGGVAGVERYRTRHADGGWRWVESRANSREDGGVATGYVINTRDVTQQVEATEDLERLDRSRSLALSAADAGVWERDLATGEVTWHESCEELYGLEPGSFEGTYDAFIDRVHPEDVPGLEDSIERAVESNGSFRATFRIVREDGTERWIDSRGEVVDDGGRERIVGVNVDITERKRRERELERYERIIETAVDPIYALDGSGEIALANGAFAEAVGVPRERLVGRNITSVLSPDDVDASLDHIESLVAAGEDTGSLELTIPTPEGKRRYEVNISITADDDAGDVPGTVGVARDVTDLRDRLQQLRVMDRVLRHNLHNDMNVVKGWAETMQREAPDPWSERAGTIVRHSENLIGIADKQRRITKVLATDPHPVPIELTSLTEEIVDRLRLQFPTARFDLDLPAGATAMATDGIGQAIEELATNAVRHADDSDPVVGISIGDTGDRVRVRIADSGPGIPEMDRRVVLGEHDIEPLYHGSGLGLWLVSWIVKRSNGELSFQEEPDGTVVELGLRGADATRDESGERGGSDAG